MKDKVSIIIPAYNVEKYIHRAIESSINQTYNNIEILIVDDGSTDNTWNIISSYCKKDKRIIAEKQPNQGVSSARNKALSMATGDYVLFIDSDDWISDNCVERLINVNQENNKIINNNKLILCDCYFAIMQDNMIKIEDSKKNYKSINVLMDYKQSMIQFCYSQYRLSSACYKLYDMKIINKYNIIFKEGISHGEDGLFVYDYLKHCNGMYYFNDALWYILDRPGSATTSQYTSKFLTATTAAKSILNDNNMKSLNKYFRYYLCSRIAYVLTEAIKSNNPKNKDDIADLKKELRKYSLTFFVSHSVKKIILYVLLAYFPNKITYRILRFLGK